MVILKVSNLSSFSYVLLKVIFLTIIIFLKNKTIQTFLNPQYFWYFFFFFLSWKDFIENKRASKRQDILRSPQNCFTLPQSFPKYITGSFVIVWSIFIYFFFQRSEANFCLISISFYSWFSSISFWPSTIASLSSYYCYNTGQPSSQPSSSIPIILRGDGMIYLSTKPRSFFV